MDNLTHTVIGLVVGAAAAHAVERLRGTRTTGLTQRTRAASFIAMGMIGGNLPDADLVVSYGDGKLGYLLQHRGYTHTLLGCLALAALLFIATLLTLRARRHTADGADRVALGAMAIVAVFLHLGMDALNSYGVHPFWPFDNSWRYGDSVFIVEPAYWIAAAPLLFVIRALAGRIALGFVLVAAPVSHYVVHAQQPGWWLGLALVTGALALGGRRLRPGFAAWLSAALMLCVTGAFFAAGRVAARELEAVAQREFPAETLLDHVLEPSPTNPFCWNFLLLQHDGTRYVARYGVLALGPQRRPEGCSRVFQRERGTAPWQAPAAQTVARLRWFGELSMPLDRLGKWVAGRCDAEALLQFVRAPFAVEADGHRVVGDLRFDREADAGFAELTVGSSPPHCPRVAPWVAPRTDLLRLGVSMSLAGEGQ